ncbi:MAG: hypothetical protein AB7S44_01240 [Spirochaetales bacterium]
MRSINFEVGTLVKSKAGRDEGSIYVVVEIKDDIYVKLADGNHKRLSNPKLKKVKHIEPLNIELPKIKEKLLNNVKVFDSEVYSAIKKATDCEQKASD